MMFCYCNGKVTNTVFILAYGPRDTESVMGEESYRR